MTTNLVFDKSINCADQITQRFQNTGQVVKIHVNERMGIRDVVYESASYRRAHISIVDARKSHKLWLLHITVFPHFNDSSPIYGFDIVAGPSRVSGAFHDFSNAGDPEHNMMKWFYNRTLNIDWNKQRPLPNWAKKIFSPAMVAIGAVGPEELDDFTGLGLESLDYYLSNVGNTQESGFDFHMAQNWYCQNQKQNPHTPHVLVNLGFSEQEAQDFVEDMLFPEVN